MIALAELKKLPLAERLQLVEELWTSIEQEQHALPDPPEVIEEIQARYARFLEDPSTGSSWENVEQESSPVVPKVVIVLPEAEADVATAYDWYATQQPGLGHDFIFALREAQLTIAEQPEIYPLRFARFRRYLLRRFPYAVYYSHNDRSVFITAVFHSSQHPDRLFSRFTKR